MNTRREQPNQQQQRSLPPAARMAIPAMIARMHTSKEKEGREKKGEVGMLRPIPRDSQDHRRTPQPRGLAITPPITTSSTPAPPNIRVRGVGGRVPERSRAGEAVAGTLFSLEAFLLSLELPRTAGRRASGSRGGGGALLRMKRAKKVREFRKFCLSSNGRNGISPFSLITLSLGLAALRM